MKNQKISYQPTATKEDGYDEWLRTRIEKAITELDSGAMKTHTIDEIQEHLDVKRAERMAIRASL